MRTRCLLLLAAAPLGAGCVARTAWNVATLPVRATGQAVDWATTSQDEADRNAGRRMRKEQERAAKERAKEDRANRKWERAEAKRQREAMDN